MSSTYNGSKYDTFGTNFNSQHLADTLGTNYDNYTDLEKIGKAKKGNKRKKKGSSNKKCTLI